MSNCIKNLLQMLACIISPPYTRFLIFIVIMVFFLFCALCLDSSSFSLSLNNWLTFLIS